MTERAGIMVEDTIAEGLRAARPDPGGRLPAITDVVDVIGFDPTLDMARNQWYADVTFDVGTLPSAYWPFVASPWCGPKPSLVIGAHVSKITQAEFTQLAPDRELSAKVAGNDVTVVVRDRQPVMLAQERSSCYRAG